MEKLSNEQLILGLNSGDARAYTHLYQKWFKRLCLLAMKITGSMEDAEDIVVDVFTKFYHANDKFEHVKNLEAFLVTAVRHASLNHVKKVKRESYNEQLYTKWMSAVDEDHIEAIVVKTELLEQILTEVQKLPDNYRNVFELYVFKGLKTDEIARRLNITPTNVTTRQNRAVHLLRIRLSEEGALFLFVFLLKDLG